MMEIRDIMSAQEVVLKNLNELLDYEKEVLIKDRASELQEIIEKKKDCAKKISLLEKKRQELIGDRKAEDMVKEGLMTQGQVDRLRKLSEDAKEKGEVNLMLTRQSIYYIRMITSALNPTQRVMTYGNAGKLDDGKSESVFNTKG